MVLQTLVNPSMSQAGTKTVQQFSKNGFTYLLGEDHSLPNIALGISLDTGAILDPIGKEGLTQITMDMLMRGTKTRSRDQINEQIEFLGATLSPNSGFTTSGVEGETLTRYIDTYMEMLGDVLLNPAFSEKELQLQKRETLDMLKLSLNNDTVLGRKNFNRLVFGDSPYGRPVDGTQASLEAITLADVQERYQSLFRKGAMTIYAAGDIDKDQLIALFEKYLPNIPDGGSKIKRLPKPTPLKQRHLVIVDKPDRTQVQIFMGHPTVAYNDPSYFPLNLIDTAFGGLFSSRYNNEIRIKRGWSYGAYSGTNYYRDAGVFFMRTFTSMQNLGDVVKKSLEMLSELSKDGLTAEELEKAKANTINEFPFRFDTAEKRVDEVLRIRAYDLPSDFLDTYNKKIAALDLDDIRKASRAHYDADNLAIVVVCEAKRCRKTLEASIESLASVTVVPYDKL